MAVNPQAYKHAMQPHTPWLHLSDEDIAAALDKSAKHSKAAHKAQERKRQRRAEQQVAQMDKGGN